MVKLISRRLGTMVLIMLVVSILLFLMNEGDPRLVARSVLGPYAQDEQLDAWIQQNGYDRAMFVRYFDWVEGNRRLVERRTNGRVGYVHIPDYMPFGLSFLLQQFLPQPGAEHKRMPSPTLEPRRSHRRARRKMAVDH